MAANRLRGCLPWPKLAQALRAFLCYNSLQMYLLWEFCNTLISSIACSSGHTSAALRCTRLLSNLRPTDAHAGWGECRCGSGCPRTLPIELNCDRLDATRFQFDHKTEYLSLLYVLSYKIQYKIDCSPQIN